jgi:hypothetical protein
MELLSNNSPEEHSLGPLINLIEMEYPNEDTDDINTLRRLLVTEFGVVFSHEDIINHYVASMEEEDMRLQYKHLNIIK